jgi:thiamine biosynthesis lipoprotein
MLLWASVHELPSDTAQKITPRYAEGKTMGTTYRIIYFDKHDRDFTPSIDSLLVLVNQSINTYDPLSEVSLFNKSKNGIRFKIPFLKFPLQKALEVASLTEGAFDPTIMPLVNAWGFGPDRHPINKNLKVDSIKQIVGYRKIKIEKDSVKKSDPRVQLDFGGIGQGYGADVVATFLKAKGVTNFLVELGGEGVASGKNLQKNSYWTVGILDPNSTRENQFFKAYVTLRDQSFTTAGNYFNYRVIDGKKYGHTIDPRTGYPVEHTLLSASVFTSDCTTADAWDTAFMVLGVDKTIALLKVQSHLDALLIYLSPQGQMQTYVTPGIKKFIVIEP